MAVGYHSGAVCDRLASLLTGGWFTSVCVVVEVSEQDDEGDSIANQSPLHPGGEWTACVEWVTCVADGDVELDLLNMQVFGQPLDNIKQTLDKNIIKEKVFVQQKE